MFLNMKKRKRTMCEESVKMFSFSCDVQPCVVKEKGKGEKDSKVKGLFCVDAETSKQNFSKSSNALSRSLALSHITASILEKGFTKLFHQKASM